MSRWIRRLIVALLAWPAAANAISNCRLTAPPFDFGLYLPGDPLPLDITGQIDVKCSGTGGQFFVTLSPGGSGSFAQRQMVSGPYLMGYNFYLNVARSTIWGDGTGGTWPYIGVKVGNGRQDFELPVYGRVFAQQAVGPGAYFDDVLVTVTF